MSHFIKCGSDFYTSSIFGILLQASVGDNTTDRPGFFDMKGKAKHDAWTARKGLSKDDAMTQYIDFSKKMLEKHGSA